MGNNKKRGQDIIVQGSILAMATLIVRFIGLAYRIPLTRIVGQTGMGYYGLAYEVYQVLILLSSSAIPAAVSKMVSARVAKHEHRNAQQIFKVSVIFAAAVSGVLALLTFFGANIISKVMFGGIIEVAPALRVLAVTVFICAIMGVFRGYTQGLGNMIPTAVSQIIEQIFNAIVSVVAAALLITKGAAYGAAGGTLGTLMGSISSLIFLYFIYTLYRPTIQKRIRRDITGRPLEDSYIIKALSITMAPLILTSTIQQISSLFDSSLFTNILSNLGYQKDFISTLYGVYTSEYLLLINLPLGLVAGLSVAVIPSISGAFSLNRFDEIREHIDSTVNFSIIISMPCAVGLAVLGGPIVSLLFNDSTTLPGRLLLVGSVTIIFYAISSLTSMILQALNRRREPVLNSVLSLAIHIIFTVVLLAFCDLNVYALIYGNVVFGFVLTILNAISLSHAVDYHMNILKDFGIPIAASVVMGGGAFVVYKGLLYVTHSNAAAVVVAIVVAALIYGVALIAMGGATEEQIEMLPKGRSLVNLLRRFHLM